MFTVCRTAEARSDLDHCIDRILHIRGSYRFLAVLVYRYYTYVYCIYIYIYINIQGTYYICGLSSRLSCLLSLELLGEDMLSLILYIFILYLIYIYIYITYKANYIMYILPKQPRLRRQPIQQSTYIINILYVHIYICILYLIYIIYMERIIYNIYIYNIYIYII